MIRCGIEGISFRLCAKVLYRDNSTHHNLKEAIFQQAIIRHTPNLET
jgi:hypothetical protein